MTDDRKPEANDLTGFATFIVRVLQDNRGRLSGVVERVRTGERVRFYGVVAISQVIAKMIERSAEDETP